jgi:hypothetical protein
MVSVQHVIGLVSKSEMAQKQQKLNDGGPFAARVGSTRY